MKVMKLVIHMGVWKSISHQRCALHAVLCDTLATYVVFGSTRSRCHYVITWAEATMPEAWAGLAMAKAFFFLALWRAAWDFLLLFSASAGASALSCMHTAPSFS